MLYPMKNYFTVYTVYGSAHVNRYIYITKLLFMKRILIKSLLILPLMFVAGIIKAQPPPAIPFQAVAKDALGNPAKNRKVFVKDVILQGAANGTKVWEEAFETQTNEDGVYTVVIGKGVKTGTTTLNDIGQIDWGNGPFFYNFKLAVAPSIPASWWVAADNYIDMGTTQLMSVPYALFAGNASVTNVTTSIPPGPPNTFLTTDSAGNVNWTTPQSASVNITQISNNVLQLAPNIQASGQNAIINPNTTTLIVMDTPGAELGDPVLITALGDYKNFNVYSAWVSSKGKVSIRFSNFQRIPIPVSGSLYKIVLIK